jgi:hypothetical protein
MATVLEAGTAYIHPEDGPVYFWYARQTIPLWRELTFTARYQGELHDLRFRENTAELPDGSSIRFYAGDEKGVDHEAYAALDLPILTGYIGEMPVFGLWNYLGCSLFGTFGRQEYAEHPAIDGSGVDRYRGMAGAKVNFLFHLMRRLPLVMSISRYYDFRSNETAYGVQADFSGLPSSFSLFPGRHSALGQAQGTDPL